MKLYLLKIIITLILFILFFFRRPKILTFEDNSNLVVRGPCFGKVIESKYNQENNTYNIAIFLSVFDIHWQLNPIDGQIEKVVYDNTGKFKLAYNLNKSRDNEKAITTYTINKNNKDYKLHLYQIAGKVARRIYTYVKPKDNVKQGQIMGLIAFGSRVDLVIENGDMFVPNIKLKDRVNGSETVIGHWKD